MSIIPKLALTFSFSIIVCVSAIASFYYFTVTNEMKGQSLELVGNTVSQTKTAIQNQINVFSNIFDMLYMDGKLHKVLFNEYYDELEDVKAADSILEFLKPISDTIDIPTQIKLYVKNETIKTPYNNQIFALADIEDAFWYQKMSKFIDKIQIWINYDDQTAGESAQAGYATIAMSRNIRHSQVAQLEASFLGVLRIDFDKDLFFRNVLDYSGNARNWIEIIDTDHRTLFKNSGEVDGSIYLDGTEGVSGNKLVDIKGKKYMAVYETIEPTQWKLVNYISFDEYSKKINHLNAVSMLIVLCVLVFFIGVAWFIAIEFTKNIRKLSGVMKVVESENLDVHIEETGSLDEVGRLTHGFNKMIARLKRLINEVYKNKLLEKEYELKALQAQMNPHFLYNFLSSISWLGLKYRAQVVADMSNALVKFYKNTLCGGKTIITVEQELEQIKSYLELQNMRYKNKLFVSYTVDQEVLKEETIKFILQPFVENSLVHGMHGTKKSINVRITVEKDGNDLVWKVIDDGVGIGNIGQDQLPKEANLVKGSGYGVVNVDQRIKTLYGAAYGVSIFSLVGIGTTVTIRLPSGIR